MNLPPHQSLMSLPKEKAKNLVVYALLRTQWQQLTPLPSQSNQQKAVKSNSNIFWEYRKGRISDTELCRHFNLPDSALTRLLIEKGELFDI